MCFTTIDILAVGLEAVKVAAASTREHHCDDDHPSDCGQHPVGSPLAKPAAARWHLHINAGNGLAAGPPSHRVAPPLEGTQAGCPSNSQALISQSIVFGFNENRAHASEASRETSSAKGRRYLASRRYWASSSAPRRPIIAK